MIVIAIYMVLDSSLIENDDTIKQLTVIFSKNSLFEKV